MLLVRQRGAAFEWVTTTTTDSGGKRVLRKQVAGTKIITHLHPNTNFTLQHRGQTTHVHTEEIKQIRVHKMLSAFHYMQNSTKKIKNRSTVEPSNDGISPYPACSSIPGEKRKFKDHLAVHSNKKRKLKKTNKQRIKLKIL